MPCRSVPPSVSTADESPIGTSGTSTVSSSVILTRKRSTWSGRRVTGWTWTPWIEDRLRLLAVDRQVDEGVRADSPAEQLEVVGIDAHGRRIERRDRRPRRAAGRRDGGGRPSSRGRRGAPRRESGGWSWRWASGRTSVESHLSGRDSPARIAGAPGNGAHLITDRAAGRRSRPLDRPGVASRRGRHDPDRRGRIRRCTRHPVRPPAGGLSGRRRPLRRGGARLRHEPGAGPRRAGRPPAGDRRLRGPPPPTGRGIEGARSWS